MMVQEMPRLLAGHFAFRPRIVLKQIPRRKRIYVCLLGVPLIPVYSTTVVAPSIHAGYSGAHRNISF